MIFNQNSFYFNSNSKKTNSFNILGSYCGLNHEIHEVDISSYISSIQTNYNVNIPCQLLCCECKYGAVYVIIIYEHPSFTKNTQISILLNNKDEAKTLAYQHQFNNPIDVNKDKGWALYSDRIGNGTAWETNNLYFNNTYSGNFGGTDLVNLAWGGGVKGHFYYQEGQLFGLDDDTPDHFVNGSDGLVEFSPYLNTPYNQLNWDINYFDQNSQPNASVYGGFFLTYTTNCIPFEVQTSRDTAICAGQSLTLNASGGQKYLWRPNQFLSCDTCANPVFSGDSSQLYTVQIWNNDTCSVTRPVKVNVIPLPKVPNFTKIPSACGAQTGKVTFQNNPNLLYQWEQNAPQSNPQFTNISGGTYSFHVIDTNGCVSKDTLVTIGTTQNTLAQFSANPNAGSPPLLVNFSNQSQNANQYNWSINGQNMGNTLNSHQFDSAGVYTVQLIALKNNDSTCADTTWLTLYIYEELQVTLPNVFTPNNDGVNDFFTITVNGPIKVKGQLLNRWGNVLCDFNETLQTGSTNLWDGKSKGNYVNDGTYFYNLVFEKAENSPPYKNEFPIKQTRFVVVER